MTHDQKEQPNGEKSSASDSRKQIDGVEIGDDPVSGPVGGSKVRSVSIALLTFRRTVELQRAIESVLEVAVPTSPSSWRLLEILVIDNNPDGLAQPVVDAVREASQAPIRYVHEGAAGIVAGRNRALDEAAGDVLVFIDDDEIALPGWPHGLMDVMADTGAAMVGGPVLFEFVETPPPWVVESGLFARPEHADGEELHWLRTGNIAIDLAQVNAAELRFDSRFPHGEDATFSMLAVKRGLSLRWSTSASVKEYVEPERTTIEWRRNRQRISSDAWVRAELDLDSSPKKVVAAVARSSYRALQGLLGTAIGTAIGRQTARNAGLARLSQARGGFEGIVRHLRATGFR